MAGKTAAPIPMAPRKLGPETGARIGKICGIDDDGRVWVDCPGLPFGPRTARTTETIHRQDAGRQVLLVFENSDPQLPIIAGLIKTPAVAGQDGSNHSMDSEEISEILVDGKTLLLEAQEEIEIRCGKSALILRRNGNVVIKGEQVVSRARQVNKIKGASVRIN